MVTPQCLSGSYSLSRIGTHFLSVRGGLRGFVVGAAINRGGKHGGDDICGVGGLLNTGAVGDSGPANGVNATIGCRVSP